MPRNISYGSNIDFGSKGRLLIFRTLTVLVMLIFLLRLTQLQIIEGSIYLSESEAQAIKQEIVEPFRGNIFDRDSNVLVQNELSYTVTLTRSDFNKETVPLLCSILETDSVSIYEQIDKYSDYSRFYPIKLQRYLEYEKVSLLEEYSDYLPGVGVMLEAKRMYKQPGNMTHLLGYTREISDRELKARSYYRPGDMMGKTGLESDYEDFLRGQPGIRYIAINRSGKKVSSFHDGKNDISPLNGFDLYLSIDSELQKLAERLLGNMRGSIVAIDPNNGEILAMVSKPDYELEYFSGRIQPEYYNKIRTNPAKPEYNRSVQAAYPPGSTWKMLVAIAGLQEHLINKNTKIVCNGEFEFGNRTFKCHGAHGAINVRRALQVSCNVFFYELGLKLGFDKLTEYGKMFGFGDLTRVDIPNEKKGILPDLEYLQEKYGSLAGVKGRLINYGIGQGEINVTPVQMAAYISAIANKGTLYQPHVVSSLYNPLRNTLTPISYESKKLPIDQPVFEIIHDGMYDVVNRAGGTATIARVPQLSVCGKTGTAQNTGDKDHSWFVCFAPEKEPEIAIVVIVENAGFGSDVAAPIARQLLQHYFFPENSNIPSKSSSDSLGVALD